MQNRSEQSPGASNITGASGGWYAPTLRYHNEMFWVINADVDAPTTGTGVFTAKDPYDNNSWSNLTVIYVGGYDPDLFFNSDGTIYSEAAITILGDPFKTDIEQFTIDWPSGNTTVLVTSLQKVRTYTTRTATTGCH